MKYTYEEERDTDEWILKWIKYVESTRSKGERT